MAGLGVPDPELKIVLQSNPPKSRILFQRLAVRPSGRPAVRPSCRPAVWPSGRLAVWPSGCQTYIMYVCIIHIYIYTYIYIYREREI